MSFVGFLGTFWWSKIRKLIPSRKLECVPNRYCPPIFERERERERQPSSPFPTFLSNQVTEDFRGLSLSQLLVPNEGFDVYMDFMGEMSMRH